MQQQSRVEELDLRILELGTELAEHRRVLHASNVSPLERRQALFGHDEKWRSFLSYLGSLIASSDDDIRREPTEWGRHLAETCADLLATTFLNIYDGYLAQCAKLDIPFDELRPTQRAYASIQRTARLAMDTDGAAALRYRFIERGLPVWGFTESSEENTLPFPIGKLIRPKKTVLADMNESGQQLAALIEDAESIIRGEGSVDELSNERILERFSGQAARREAVLDDQLEQLKKRQKHCRRKLEKWIQTSFDSQTSEDILSRISPRNHVLVVGGGALQRIKDLRRRCSKYVDVIEDLEVYIDEYEQNTVTTNISMISSEGTTLSSKSEQPDHTQHAEGERDTVLVFVALGEEFDVLKERWSLNQQFGASAAVGRREHVDVHVITPRKAGRVPAAIKTLHHIMSESIQYRAVFVLGIAGGFLEEGVNRGDVIIANRVVDLASRKIREEDNDVPVEFRPDTYDTGIGLEEFVNSDLFNTGEWQISCAKNRYLPAKGYIPTIHAGPITSIDEVVSDDDWRASLLKASPKLLGVEMEAAGVCAALKKIDYRPPIVVRGVSDHANPAKSDDGWRQAAMDHAVSIVEMFLDHWEQTRDRC